MGATKNIMIGVFVIVALAIITFIMLFLHPSVGDNARTLRVRFTDIDKITLGTRVSYAGRPVGEVVAIQEIEDARTGRIAQNGDIYVYELILKVDSSVNVYNTDVISIRTSGLLGEKSISIMPEPTLPGEDLFLVNDQILYAIPSGSVEETFKQISGLAKKFGQVLDDISDVFTEIKDEQVVNKLARTVQNVHDISQSLNQPEKWQQTLDNVWSLSQRAHDSWTTLDKSFNNIYEVTDRAKSTWTTIDNSMQNFYDLTERAQHTWTTIDRSMDNFYALTNRAHQSWTTIDQSLGQFNQGSANFNKFTDQLNQIATYTSQGQGSVGRLFMDDEIYLRLKSIFSKGETIMNDVNQFGVLFHQNKNWQRLNARRLRLLERLSTPDQFSAYFNDELNQISSSLSRVSMVLKETGECYPQNLICNPDYKRQFSELIRRVGDIEDSLKMYNQQVVDQECE